MSNLTTIQQNRIILTRLFRLTKMIPQRKDQLIYNSIIKTRLPYPERLKIALGERCDDTTEQAMQRKMNTLAFVAEALIKEGPMKTKLVKNILEHEESKIDFIAKNVKGDLLIGDKFNKMEYFNRDMKGYELFGSVRQFDEMLMRLNQTMGMQL